MPRPLQLVGGEAGNPHAFKFAADAASPYLNAEKGARYLQLFVKDENGFDSDVPNVEAFRLFVRRHNITNSAIAAFWLIDVNWIGHCSP